MRKGDDPAGGTAGNVHPLWTVSIRQSIQHLSRCDSETQKCGGTRGNLSGLTESVGSAAGEHEYLNKMAIYLV